MVNGLWSKVNPFSSRRSQPAQAAPLQRPDLAVLAQQPEQLPDLVKACPVAQKYLKLLGDLDWAHFPERPTGPGRVRPLIRGRRMWRLTWSSCTRTSAICPSYGTT